MMSKIRKVFGSGRVFHSRFQKLKFYLGVFHRLFILLNLVFLVFAGFLALNIFQVSFDGSASHYGDDRTVYISEASVENVSSVYDSDLEKGFCLYGSRNESSFVLEEVVNVDADYQSRSRVEFSCMSATVSRIPELVNNESMFLLGGMHTHPLSSKLSRPDSYRFGVSGNIYGLTGIYNGRALSFYSGSSLSRPLEMVVLD